jgi:hypothetical protein
VILFKVQDFFAKLRKNLAPEQFKSLYRHARVKVLLNCSAGINYKIFGGEAHVGSGREQKNMVEGGRGKPRAA